MFSKDEGQSTQHGFTEEHQYYQKKVLRRKKNWRMNINEWIRYPQEIGRGMRGYEPWLTCISIETMHHNIRRRRWRRSHIQRPTATSQLTRNCSAAPRSCIRSKPIVATGLHPKFHKRITVKNVKRVRTTFWPGCSRPWHASFYVDHPRRLHIST